MTTTPPPPLDPVVVNPPSTPRRARWAFRSASLRRAARRLDTIEDGLLRAAAGLDPFPERVR